MQNSLFERAKMGDARSIELLVDQYYRLAYSTAYEWIRKGVISKDDGLSEAHMALMKCIRGNFDPQKGDFTSYLVRAVDNQIRMYLRCRNRDRAFDYVNPAAYAEGESLDLVDTLPDTSCDVEADATRSVLFANAIQILETDQEITTKEAICLLLRAEGRTCSEIATMFDISQSYVSRLSNMAMEKMQDRMK